MKKLIPLFLILIFVSPVHAAKWLQIPATTPQTVAVPNNYNGVTYTGNYGNWQAGGVAVTRAWSGGAWDDANRRMYLFGGGHGDYIGNEVYVIDMSLTTGVTVKRLTNPDTDSYQGSSCGSQGNLLMVPGTSNPVSRHSYGNLTFIPAADSGLSEDTMFMYGGSAAWCSNFGTDTWLFGTTSHGWTQANDGSGVNPAASALSVIYHHGNKKVYTVNNHSGTMEGFFSYDVTNNTWTKLKDFSVYKSVVGYWGAAIDTVGNDYYFMGGGHLYKVNVNGSPDYEYYEITGITGDTEIMSAFNPGMDYDSKYGKLVAWDQRDHSTSIYTFDISAKTWTKSTPGGTAPIGWTWGGSSYNGIFGRFAYSSKMASFVIIPDFGANVSLYCPDDYPTDLWFGRTLSGTGWSNVCEGGGCKHSRMEINPNDGLIYFFGGDHGPGSQQADVMTYTVDTDTWTSKVAHCATDGVVQFDGMDEGPLFFSGSKFYYHNAGNYCQQCTTGTGTGTPPDCGPTAIYDPTCTHHTGSAGACANSTMYSGRFMMYDPSSNTWDGVNFLTTDTLTTRGATNIHWGYYDATSNTVFVPAHDGNGTMFHKYDMAGGWTYQYVTTVHDFYYAPQMGWAHDVSGRVIYGWDADTGHGQTYKYDIATATFSTLNSSAPTPGGYGQYQLIWDSTNEIILTNESWDSVAVPMKFHTYKPSTNTWTKNIAYNTWNGLKPYGRNSIYDSVHNLYINFGSDEGAEKTNQIFFYRYGGGAPLQTDISPPSVTNSTVTPIACTSSATIRVTAADQTGIAGCVYGTTSDFDYDTGAAGTLSLSGSYYQATVSTTCNTSYTWYAKCRDTSASPGPYTTVTGVPISLNVLPISTEIEEQCTGQCLISVSWTSTNPGNEKNTGAGNLHVFSNSTGGGTTLTLDQGSNGYTGETNSLKYSDSGTSIGYDTQILSTPVDQVSHRYLFNPATLGIGNGQSFPLDRIGDSPQQLELYARIMGKAVGYEIQLCYWNTNGSTMACTANGSGLAISTGTKYQVTEKWLKNTASDTGAVLILYDINGNYIGTLTGAGGANKTSDMQIDRVGIGPRSSPAAGGNTVYFDIYRAEGGASQSIIGPRTPAVTTSTFSGGSRSGGKF